MLLEVKVFGSYEWYEVVYPKFNVMGFREIEELAWADPETDGEVTGHYFEFVKKEGMTVEEMWIFIKDMEKIIMDGEAPYIKMKIVPQREYEKEE